MKLTVGRNFRKNRTNFWKSECWDGKRKLRFERLVHLLCSRWRMERVYAVVVNDDGPRTGHQSVEYLVKRTQCRDRNGLKISFPCVLEFLPAATPMVDSASLQLTKYKPIIFCRGRGLLQVASQIWTLFPRVIYFV